MDNELVLIICMIFLIGIALGFGGCQLIDFCCKRKKKISQNSRHEA